MSDRPTLIYGDQAAVFPVDTDDGKIWMSGRDDLPWQGAYIVWCQPNRLRNLLRHTTSIRFPENIDRWSADRRKNVETSMAASTPEWPVPVGCLDVLYLPRRLSPRMRNWLEARGLHDLTIRVQTSFMDGMHRTAWLVARRAPFIPLMVNSVFTASALETHAGARVCHINLEKLQSFRRSH